MRIEKPWEYSFCDQCIHCFDDDMCNAYTFGVGNAYCPQIRDCDKFECAKKPQTNAVRIRAMSDEELADYWLECTCVCDWCALKAKCDGDTISKVGCMQGVLEWLKQPAEGE